MSVYVFWMAIAAILFGIVSFGAMAVVETRGYLIARRHPYGLAQGSIWIAAILYGSSAFMAAGLILVAITALNL